MLVLAFLPSTAWHPVTPRLVPNAVRGASRTPHAFASMTPVRRDDVTFSPNEDDDSYALIEATKAFMERGNGFFSQADSALFAEDFCFQGEILGPMNKARCESNRIECSAVAAPHIPAPRAPSAEPHLGAG